MFVEGDVEVRIKDRSAVGLDDHETKLWLQRSFKNMMCYRISNLAKETDREIRATVALKISDLPADERQLIESHQSDVGMLRSFIERMFEGKGTLRALGDPKIKQS